MPKRIYQVEAETKWTNCSSWLDESINVLSNGNALKAVQKAKRHFVGQTYIDVPDSGRNKGKQLRVRCTSFRLKSVDVVAEADI